MSSIRYESACHGNIIVILTSFLVSSVIGAELNRDVLSADHWSDFSNSVIAVVVAVSAAVSTIIVLIVCADLCPKRPTTYRDYGNDDAFFGDIRIGPPPVIEFGMIPPIETADESRSAGRIVFEPLPDIAARRRNLQAGGGQGGDEVRRGEMVSRMRPKICKLERQRIDSGDIGGGGEEEVVMDIAMERLKLDRMIANSRQEFPRTQLQYIKELGIGWFGKVLQGEGQGILPGHKKTKVVVQMLKEDADQHSQFAFLQEGTPYRDIDHANVVKLLGQCIETLPYLTVLEHCPAGDLKTYLKTRRNAVESLDSQGLLLNFACDMAAGLQAMHQNFYVHRDFALRNCLVTADMSVKVGDYGLSEDAFKEDYYFDDSGVGIPIRWLSPEVVQFENSCVSLRTITRDSNLWSFGVALWELTTFGAQPYSDLTNENVLRLVISEQSIQLSRPDTAISNLDRLYQLMQMCWLEPTRRPSLRELRIMLLHLRSSRNQDDTSAFDQKWNQLMPRQHTDNPPNPSSYITAGPPQLSAAVELDPRVSSVSNPRSYLDAPVVDAKYAPSVVAADNRLNIVDLSSISGDFLNNRPSTSFESEDASELNASLLAQAGSRQISLRSTSGSRTGTPDSPATTRSRNELLTSPLNELSFAAEIHATSSYAASSSVMGSSLDDDMSIYCVSSVSGARGEVAPGVGGRIGGVDGFDDDVDLGTGAVSGARGVVDHHHVLVDVHPSSPDDGDSLTKGQWTMIDHVGDSSMFGSKTKDHSRTDADDFHDYHGDGMMFEDNRDATLKHTDATDPTAHQHSPKSLSEMEYNASDLDIMNTPTSTPPSNSTPTATSPTTAAADNTESNIAPILPMAQRELFGMDDTGCLMGDPRMGEVLPGEDGRVSGGGRVEGERVGGGIGAERLFEAAPRLEIGTEMERFAAGEELIGDDTPFGEQYMQQQQQQK